MVCVFSTEDNDFTLVILKGFFWDPNQTWSIPVIIKKKAGQISESSGTMNHGFYVFLKKNIYQIFYFNNNNNNNNDRLTAFDPGQPG